MATLSCTLNGYTSYNGSKWYKTSYVTTEQQGEACYGKDSVTGLQRALVLKFTTPKLPDNYTNRYLTIKVPLFRYGGQGSDKFYYRISTTGPTLTNNSGPQHPAAADCFSGSQNVTTTNSYKKITFKTRTHAFVGNTTYYLWLISNTPNGQDGVLSGNYAHNSAKGYISVTMNYTDSATYTKPTVSLSGYKGYYSGATLSVSGTGHIYMATSLNGTYYHKGSGTTCTVDADTTSTSKTVYIFRCDTHLGTNTSGGYPPSSTYIASYSVPRFACRVYCHSTSDTKFTGNSGTFTPTAVSGYTFVGLTESATATSKTYDPNWNTDGPSINGKTLYAIYKGTKTVNYYCGGPTVNSKTATKYLYGKTSETRWDFITPLSFTCESNSNFTHIGWTGSSSSYSVSYTSIYDAAEDYSTIYGIFEYSNYSAGTKSGPYYRGTSTAYTWSQTGTYDKAYYYGTGQISYGTLSYTYNYDLSCVVDSSWGNAIGATTSSSSFTNLSNIENLINSVQTGTKIYLVYKRTDSMTFYIPNNGGVTVNSDNYLYGTGLKTNNIPLEPNISDYDVDTTKFKLAGWASSSSGTPLTWAQQWNNGIRTVYAILIFNNNIYYGVSGVWKPISIYYGVNGEWKPVLLRFGVNNTWK